MVVSGAIVIAAGFGVAIVRALGFPSWVMGAVVAGAVVALWLVRALTRP
jgi:hypothetical protein